MGKIKNISDFIRYIPTARGTQYEDIHPFIEESEIWIQTSVIGADVFNKIYADDDNEPIRLLNSIVVLKAYAGAIPFLDVVQTNNGFAVVSTTNVVPASRERVDKLLAWVDERLYFHVDSLIEYISTDAGLMTEWRKFDKFDQLTELLFWTGTDFVYYSGDYHLNYNRKRDVPFLDLRKYHSVIRAHQNETIASYISKEYLDELIEKRRSAPGLAEDDRKITERLKFVVGLLMIKDERNATEQLHSIVNMMMKDLSKYSAFANSEAYKLKIAERYENKQSDPTYFFV